MIFGITVTKEKDIITILNQEITILNSNNASTKAKIWLNEE